ncbi:hypothetical protein [Nannocystis pusilla]|uniref:Lipoprotein n=1 Tax=Nannocystis pusilla TaxID=889268 RepID=A0ABS7TIP5_9BACT|nr:hypothetical protein [Nannocystis pusilla]MBZ5708071.1 hypothetical protein [Nannocystis pusilla]
MHRRAAMMLSVALAGCDPAETPDEAPAQAKATVAVGTAPAPPMGPRVLAELDLGKGHVVVFEELEAGMISVLERGSVDDPKRVVTPELMREGAAAVWTTLAPGQAMPPALAAALDRQAEREVDDEPASPKPVAPPNLPVVTVSPTRDDWEQKWFKDTFCTRVERTHCTQGWEWAESTSDMNSGEYEAVALQGREGTQTATFTTDWWKCRRTCEFFDCELECWWERGSTDPIAPGTWVGRHYDNDPGLRLTGGTTYKAEITGATGALVSLRTMWEPWHE